MIRSQNIVEIVIIAEKATTVLDVRGQKGCLWVFA
jgi:hypothetical protein